MANVAKRVTVTSPDGQRRVTTSLNAYLTCLKDRGWSCDEGEDGFEPSRHSVDEVNAYLADTDDEEQARVLAAEKSGKARKSILGA